MPTFSVDAQRSATSERCSENDNFQPSVSLVNSMSQNLLDLAADWSSSSSMFDQSSVANELIYGNCFNSTFMTQAVSYFANEFAQEFSITEYLPAELREQDLVDCSCCLCQLNEENDTTLNVCIQQHPRLLRCKKSKRGTVCSACMSSMTLNSKKTKSNLFRCCIDLCAEELNKKDLRKHYLKHFNVNEFQCGNCEMNYPSKGALKKHERLCPLID